MTDLTHSQQLALIARAWGKQEGWCFFPWISGKAGSREERIKSYHEGQAYYWPRDKDAILEHMGSHTDDDLYWCPSLFERKRRTQEFAMDEMALWADLDEKDPKGIKDYPPTMAWESSPGRYQAVWLLTPGTGDLQGASWQGGENQRLTYYLGADTGGWDTTQLLRIPGWRNHKFEWKKKYGKVVEGKLLWANGRRYLPDDFEDLPEVPNMGEIEEIFEDQIDAIDTKEVWGRVRLKVSKEVRELFSARSATGDRSERLWQIERDLADAGCTAVEIVALARGSVWNKYNGRQDEFKRLILEASKAIQARPLEVEKGLEDERQERPKPTRLTRLLADVRPPRWLVQDVWVEGALGFIGGQPKSFKSWFGLDLALSVSTGMDFLERFRVLDPGPVLLIQEEDPLAQVKVRFDKIWPAKQADRMTVVDGEVIWLPASEVAIEPDVDAYVGESVVLSDPGWQAWLDETLDDGFGVGEGAEPGSKPYKLLIVDTLMSTAGDIDEAKSNQLQAHIFKPLREICRAHGLACAVIHHMRKGGDPGTRGGQRLLGGTAIHAWSEHSLYLSRIKGGVRVEIESKHVPEADFDVRGLNNRKWTPQAGGIRGLAADVEVTRDNEVITRGSNTRSREPAALRTLKTLGPGEHSRQAIIASSGISSSAVYQQLKRLELQGLVERNGNGGWLLKR